MSVDVSDVAYLRWDASKIAIVEEAMSKDNKKMSARQLATALENIGVKSSHQNLGKLLNGKYSVISLEIAEGICKVLSIPVEKLVKIYKFSGYLG